MEGWFLLQRSKACLAGWQPGAAKQHASSCLLARWHSHQPANQTSYLYSAGWSNLGGWESASVEMPQSTSTTVIIESARRSVSDGTLARNLECKIAPMTPNRIHVVPCPWDVWRNWFLGEIRVTLNFWPKNHTTPRKMATIGTYNGDRCRRP
jgi:hypothetical protein